MKKTVRACSVRMVCLLFCLLLLGTAGGCKGGAEEKETGTNGSEGTGNAPISRYSLDYLDTFIEIKVYGEVEEDVLDHCFVIIAEYEEKLSRTREGTQIYRLNENKTETLDKDVLELIEKGLYYSELSGGAFDITAEPITSLWDFKAESPALPDEKVLAEAATHVDYSKLSLYGNQATLEDPESGVDLGAIAKGYIADRVKEYLVEQGVKSAIINLGGNVLCVGKKPDGTAFQVGMQYPFGNRNELIAIIQIDDFSVVTSGIDQRNFTIDGKLYHHILDTETGYPCENNLLSVTIISEKSVDGDGLSTTCFALGLEEGMALIDRTDGVYAAFVTDDYDIHYSEGFEEHLTVTDKK